MTAMANKPAVSGGVRKDTHGDKLRPTDDCRGEMVRYLAGWLTRCWTQRTRKRVKNVCSFGVTEPSLLRHACRMRRTAPPKLAGDPWKACQPEQCTAEQMGGEGGS